MSEIELSLATSEPRRHARPQKNPESDDVLSVMTGMSNGELLRQGIGEEDGAPRPQGWQRSMWAYRLDVHERVMNPTILVNARPALRRKENERNG